MRLKITWSLCLVAGLGSVLALLMVVKWTATVSGQRAAEATLTLNSSHLEVTSAPPPEPVPMSVDSPQQQVISDTQRALQPPRPAAAEETTSEPTQEPSLLTDPAAKEKLGRLALSYVGADAFADDVWAWLINDPQLSPKVRQDLIEDLNENGFSEDNGRRATVDDLPLIESRILLLEEHAPFAVDEVNAAAFAEAYKDLANMWWRLNR